jgi:uncharacterized ferritin-like protein (DUF455 family)
MPSPANSVHEFCRRVLRSGNIEDKLAAPLGEGGLPLADPPEPALALDRPVRDSGLALHEGAERLPSPGALHDPAARAECLARFANHELMAVELFAWALLRWPALPAALRRSWLGVLSEEQEHCRLYLARLSAHGSRIEDHSLSGYFWRQAPAIAASPHGPKAFLCAMGLTLEQANLDFSLTYRDAFRDVGDEESARVCQRVHDDEVQHVRLAAIWLERLSAKDASGAPPTRDIDLYLEAVPFPMSPARAKGRRFDVPARRRAGLSEAFIEQVRSARSSQNTKPSDPGGA